MILPKVYRDLLNLAGISGYEQYVRKYMEQEIKKYPSYTIQKDRLGSIFAYKPAKNVDAPTIMVAGHMDEVGLMVVKILKNGMLKLQPIGGLSGEVFVSQVLNVHTKSGIIKGIVGAIPPHLKQSQQTNLADMILDVGASSKEEAIAFGVELGNMVLFDNPFSYTQNKKRVIAKAIDNRYGCGLALEAIKAFADIELPYHLVIGATVQEEVGLRGAQSATQTFKPDIFIALDASPVNDAVDCQAQGALGNGYLIRIYDPKNIMHQGLLQFFLDVSRKHKIPYQYFTSQGGTDAAKALDLLNGIPATTIGLPARYIHSTAAMMDLDDLRSARKMLFKVLLTLSPDIITRLVEGNYV